MTQLHLIEQARQGDPDAIAALMNKSLQPKGMTATVERYGDRLEVLLEAERVPNRQALTAFVEKGISNLGIQVIQSIKVSGRESGAAFSTWTEELHLSETPTPEFEPEVPAEPAMTPGLEPNTVTNAIATEPGFHEDFNMDAVAESVQDEQRLNELTQLTDLSQLQDLLSEEPERPISERQRQLLEEQIETIWQEQSNQSDNFLTDLMSSAPEEPEMQFEAGSDASLGVQFPDEGQSDQFWQSSESEFDRSLDQDFSEFGSEFDSEFSSEFGGNDALLNDLTTDQPETADSGELDLEAFSASSASSDSALQDSSQDWMSALGDEEEPDEILTGFMDNQPQAPILDFDEVAGEEDEPDEILLDFLPRQEETVEESADRTWTQASPQFETEADELAGLPSEAEIVNFFEETTEPIAELTSAPVAEDSITFLRDLPSEFMADDSDMAVDTPEQDLSFLDDAQMAIEEGETQPFEADEFSSEFGSSNDFGLDEFRNESSELSFDDVSQTDDVSLTFDDSSDQPGSFTDAPVESWDQPPIEFLQDEPDLALPEMPTEQLDEPLVGFTMDSSSLADSPPSLGDAGGFPQGFLQSQEPSGDSSEEFYVDPNENPFIEPMEENRDRPDEFPSDTPKPSDGEFEAFDQTDWQLPDDEPNFAESGDLGESDEFDLSGLSSDLSELSLEPLEPFESEETSASPEGFTFSEEPSNDLSDEALDNFFATDSQAPSQDIDPASPIAEPMDPDFQLDQYGQPDELSQLGTFEQGSAFGSLDELGQPDPYSQSGEFGQLEEFGRPDEYSQSDPYSQSGEYRQPNEYSESDEFGLGEPFATSSSSIPTRPPSFPEGEVPESQYPPTEIPGSQLADTQLPMREELSQEALEEQLEAYEFGQPPREDPSLNRTIDRDDRMVPVDPDAEAPAENRGSPWLFPLIFLGISGWIVGLISFAFLWSRLSSPPPLLGQNDSPADVAADDPAAPVADACTPPAEGGAPVALSNLQFQPNTANPQQINLVGCVTNRTEQAIDIVSVAYRSGAGGGTVGGLAIPDNLIQPGQTVAFTSRFTVPSDVPNVAIDTVFWQPAGGATSQEAGTSIQVNR
jgi:hypothetical protein